MKSGRQTLQEIQGALKQEQQRLHSLDAELSKANDELMQLDSQRATSLKQLAQLRLQYLATGEASTRQFSDTAAAIQKLIGARDEAYALVQNRLSSHEAQQAKLDERASALADDRERYAQELSEAEKATQERLASDPAYRAQLAAAKKADRVAKQASAKASQSEEERTSKGAAYESDKLFMYLWSRHYGTTEYEPGGGLFRPLIRHLDGKVARLIDYATARPNYQRLTDLPKRLREHADNLAAAAEREFEEVKRLDLAGREADGIPKVEKQLDDVGEALEALAKEREELGTAAKQVREELATFARGDDANYAKAIQLLRTELEETPLDVLRAQALATPSPDDDVIVARLRELTANRDRVAGTIKDRKESADKFRERLEQIEKLRNDFARAGMDAPNTSFRDPSTITNGINQVLTGLLTVEALWRILNQQRVVTKTPSDPNFGSGGFGRGSVWGGGTAPNNVGGMIGGIVGEMLEDFLSGPGRSSGPFSSGSSRTTTTSSTRTTSRTTTSSRPSSSGRSSSGGFRTGGKVGGGKFKTGGKF